MAKTGCFYLSVQSNTVSNNKRHKINFFFKLESLYL